MFKLYDVLILLAIFFLGFTLTKLASFNKEIDIVYVPVKSACAQKVQEQPNIPSNIKDTNLNKKVNLNYVSQVKEKNYLVPLIKEDVKVSPSKGLLNENDPNFNSLTIFSVNF